MRTRYLTSLTNAEINEYLKRNDIIFVPVGVVEVHGGFPVDCEYVGALAWAQKLAEEVDGLVLPNLSYFYPGGTAPASGNAAGNRAGGSNGADPVAARAAALPGPVTGEHDPQAIFATESLAQALRQLEIYGRDGLPVLSDDGQRIVGWVTSTSVLGAVAHEIRGAQEQTADAQAAADTGQETPDAAAAQPPNPLPGYRIVEITLADDSPAAGTRLGDVSWPPGYVPVSLLRDRNLRRPDPRTVIHPGDRIALLIPDAS